MHQTAGARRYREQPHARYVFVHSRLNEPTVAELDEIVEYLAQDPDSRRVRETPGRPDGVRYALGIAVAHVRELKRKAAGG